MAIIRIDRFDDPRLDDYRNVSDAELLRRRNRFVAEGRLVVERLIESRHRVDSVLVNDASFHALDTPLSRLPSDVPIYVCNTEEFTTITGFNLHRGCLAIAERPVNRSLDDVVRSAGRILILERVADADNVGSAFRNAAAFGASVVLSETCCDPLYRKAIRTSMGAVLRTPYARADIWPRDLAILKDEGFTIVALTPRTIAMDLHEYLAERVPARVALLVGSEGPGLTPEAEAIADARVRIPMRGDVDSLNLATASAIALYHFGLVIP
jgi:tRNA G18 (ribose-2'-O)-methylase SpoU